jgi:hypothetical protein
MLLDWIFEPAQPGRFRRMAGFQVKNIGVLGYLPGFLHKFIGHPLEFGYLLGG